MQLGPLLHQTAVHGATPGNVPLPGLSSSVSSVPSGASESGASAVESRVWDIPAESMAAPLSRTPHDLETLHIAAREKAEQDRLSAEQERIAREREQAERLRPVSYTHLTLPTKRIV